MLVCVVVLLTIVLIKIINQQDDRSPTILKANKINLLNASQKPYWNGADSALVHEIGTDGSSGVWTSGDSGYGYLVLGPYINLAPDSYKILYELKVDGILNKSRLIATIEITQDNGTSVLVKELYGSDFDAPGVYKKFAIPLVSGKIMNDVEFRVHHSDTGVNLSVKSISLSPDQTVWAGNDPLLKHDLGQGGSSGTWAYQGIESGYLISDGPHLNLAPGVYDVSYSFVIDDYLNESMNVTIIEISYKGGQKIGMVNDGVLKGGDFNLGRVSNEPVIESFANRL